MLWLKALQQEKLYLILRTIWCHHQPHTHCPHHISCIQSMTHIPGSSPKCKGALRVAEEEVVVLVTLLALAEADTIQTALQSTLLAGTVGEEVV